MKKRKLSQTIAAIVLFVLAIALVVVGFVGYGMRGGDYVNGMLVKMQDYAVLRTAASGIIDEIALKTRIEARKYADEQGYSRNQRSAYAEEQEAIARADAEIKYAKFEGLDTSGLNAQIIALQDEQKVYYDQMNLEYTAYAEEYLKQLEAAENEPVDEAVDEAVMESEVITEDDTGEVEVDYTKFVPSEKLLALEPAMYAQYDLLWAELVKLLPDLTDDLKEDLRNDLLNTTYDGNASFEGTVDRYISKNAANVYEQGDSFKMYIVRNGAMLFTIGFGLIIISLVVYFYQILVAKLTMPRLILSLFFIFLCIAYLLYGMSLPYMLGNVLTRMGMYGVLALAMLPGIQCGIGLNLGMTIGCIGGLLGTMIVLQYNMTGWASLIVAILLGIAFSIPLGWAYSKLLNKLKGNEMTVSTYVGFSFVSLMCIGWMLLPFNNPKILWILGSGLRANHNLNRSFGDLLNNTLSFNLLGTQIPTGLLLFFFLCCFLMYLFSRSKTGTAMIAVGTNPRFAEAAGINVNRMRTIGTILSTVIAAVGIIVYEQSLGYAQLYSAPRQMGFIAASAILIGGATTTRAKVSHVIFGAFLFQGVLALGIQVANSAVSGGGLSEVMRIMISNGIILYALTQSGGGSRA